MSTSQHAVSIETERIFLLSDVYQAYFAQAEAVRLGTHTEHPLIYIQPTTAECEFAYKISYQSVGGRINCRSFLRQHNYHHKRTQRYQAAWSEEVGSLVVDLSVPVSE